MKKFLIKVLLFVFIPVIGVLLIEAIFSPTFFTYRAWESIVFNTEDPDKLHFYPNSALCRNGEGDLCHHTGNAILKKECWVTDKLGFRNDEFINQPDVLFIGDSFIAGSALNQDETITNQVKKNSGGEISVYNMAPSSLSAFDRYYQSGAIKKTKLLIFSIVERDLPRPMVRYNPFSFSNGIDDLIETGNTGVYIDKAAKCLPLKWLMARVRHSKGPGIPATGDSSMFFLSGNTKKHLKEDLYVTAKIISSYKKYCDSLGIAFLFLPMPDKETVYYDLVPLDQQPRYLFQLDSLLAKEKVPAINTLKIYNDFRKNSRQLLYHPDDTHWNSAATNLLSKELIKRIREVIR